MASRKAIKAIMKGSAPSLCAIRVGQGDAFFMKKGVRSILIDGGRSVLGFPQQFQIAVRQNRVDILVCTHNDSDHANGILGFLNASLSADEVWLPASWMDRLEDILLHPRDFLMELSEDVENLREVQVSDLSELGSQYASKTISKRDSRPIEVRTQDIYDALEKVSDANSFLGQFQAYHPASYPPYYLAHGELFPSKLFVEAVSGAALMKEIVLSAYHSGSLIKWFDFVGDKDQSSASGGVCGFLVPVNATEVGQIRRPKRGALEHIALTKANEQSLVFISPNNDGNPGALFTADSDLSFYQKINWHDNMLITAPHHGSEANKKAYDRFYGETGGRLDVTWIRSDGRFNKRPGNSFLAIKNRKFCTLCRNSSLPKQNVRLKTVGCSWQPVDNTKTCICK